MDLLALYMLMLLFRQAVYTLSSSSSSSSSPCSIHAWELDRVKKEIWELCPERPGWRFFKGGIGVVHKAGEENEEKWKECMRRVTLQIGRRASEVVSRSNRNQQKGEEDGCAMMSVPQSPGILSVLEGWVDKNFCEDSELRGLMHKRLREVMLQFVRASAAVACNPNRTCFPSTSLGGMESSSVINVPPGLGLEALIPEIQHLGERISNLAVFHTRVFGEIYEDSEFL